MNVKSFEPSMVHLEVSHLFRPIAGLPLSAGKGFWYAHARSSPGFLKPLAYGAPLTPRYRESS